MEIPGFDKVLILWWKKNQNQNKTLTFQCYPVFAIYEQTEKLKSSRVKVKPNFHKAMSRRKYVWFH